MSIGFRKNGTKLGFQKGHPKLSNSFSFQKGHIAWNKGKHFGSSLVKCDRCSKAFYCRQSLISKYQHHYCSRRCYFLSKKGTKEGSKNPFWKGGKFQKTDGHWLRLCPNHPFATKSGYVRQSRLVMEKKIGRYLTRREVVHHINGDPSNDRPENLMLFPNQPAHLKYHLSLTKFHRYRKAY